MGGAVGIGDRRLRGVEPRRRRVVRGARARERRRRGCARLGRAGSARRARGDGVQVVWVSRQDGASVVRAAKAVPGEQPLRARDDGPRHEPDRGPRLGVAGRWARTGRFTWRGWTAATLRPRRRGVAAATGHAGTRAMRQDLFQAVRLAGRDRAPRRASRRTCASAARRGSPRAPTAPSTSPGATSIRPTCATWRWRARPTEGGRSSAPVRVSEDGWALDGCPDDGPSIAVDARGAVHIAWPTLVPGSASGKGIFYSYSRDGGRTFAASVRLDEGDGRSAHPQLAVGGRPCRRGLGPERSGQRRIHTRTISSDPKAAAWTLCSASPRS